MLEKLAALPLVAFIVIIEPFQAIAQQTAPQPPQDYLPPHNYFAHGPWDMWHYGYGGHFFWMFPLMIMFFLLICGAVFLFAHRSGCCRGMHHWGPPSHTMNRPWGDPTYSALQILNERFARGEIQKDEYTEKKAAILSGGRA
jgi:putative membrane protein